MDFDSNDQSESEIEILVGIRNELRELNSQIARTDERSQQNRSDVETLREDRISPLEKDVTMNENRSRRNSLILGAGLTVSTILAGAGVTYGFSIL